MVHSLKKLMHPRNKYTKSPNFKTLAILYPTFRNIIITDIAGNVKIDFKNTESLRVLTETLLLHDFDLKIKIPADRLVPTVSLRLNYVLWIEDLMKYSGVEEPVKGIDIGTGAVCIYPLLLVKICNYRMIATEIDKISSLNALTNVEKNNFQDSIKVLTVNKETIFKDVIKDEEIHHFSMCNPPFFKHDQVSKSKKQPPKNAPTGTKLELQVEQGEVGFITKMITESRELKERIQIYTTMVGCKDNMNLLNRLLDEYDIENKTWTEFCQGRTKRWGLAWTFLSKSKIDLTEAPVIREKNKTISKSKVIEIIVPEESEFNSIENLSKFFHETADKLKLELNELDLQEYNETSWTCELIAKQDTWSHARRRRRMEERSIENPQPFDIEPEQTKESYLIATICITTEPNKILTIHLSYERGKGGQNGLETFRHYLINRLNIKTLTKPNSNKKRKKKKKKTTPKRMKLE